MMTLKTVKVGVGLCLAVLAGCSTGKSHSSRVEASRIDSGTLSTAYTEEASENAVLRQRTIYPYHFVNGTPRLNDLGRREMSILARHYRFQPGAINVVSGDIHQDLYNARIEAVRAVLIDVGVEESLITIVDNPPGGDGMLSVEIMKILGDDVPRSVTFPEIGQK